MSAHRFGTPFLAGALLLAAAVAPARAQDVVDARWLAFVGCWEPVGVDAEAGLLCFRPEGSGVEMLNVLAGDVTGSEMLIADGEAREVSAEGCEGSESVEFSADGRRAFTRSDFVCEGGVARSGTGVMSVVSPTEWVDVRSLSVGGEPVAWVQRYRLVGADRLAVEGVDDPAAGLQTAVRAMRMAAATDIGVEDVEEAVAEVDVGAVEAWVAAQQDELRLDADELVRLADGGVPESVIDVMVAVSYPDRFVIEPGEAPDQVAAARGDRGAYGYPRDRGYRSFMWDPFYSRYGGFGYSPFGYSPFGYFGSGFGYYGYTPTRIVVDRRPVAAGGYFVKGQGYTRGSSTAGGTGRIARPRGGGGGGASMAPSRAPSSQPASSGGRRAKRRPGG